MRVHPHHVIAGRRRFKEAPIAVGDDHRADVLAVGDVVDARELGQAPFFAALLEAGADKVSINTAAVNRREFVREAADKFGEQCIVVAIDAKKVSAEGEPDRWEIFTHGGRNRTGIDAVEYAKEVVALGAGETLGIVGESGSGKTVFSRATMGLLRGSSVHRTGQILFEGTEIPLINKGQKVKVMDKPSIVALTRVVTENFLTFNYIYSDSISEDEKQFKFNKSAERLFTDKTTQQNTKMDVKEIIEQHAEI